MADFINSTLENLWDRLIAATESICGIEYPLDSYYGKEAGIKTIHDDLLKHFGKTRSNTPKTPGDYLRGISVIASYHKTGTFNTSSAALSFKQIVEYLETEKACAHPSTHTVYWDSTETAHTYETYCEICGELLETGESSHEWTRFNCDSIECRMCGRTKDSVSHSTTGMSYDDFSEAQHRVYGFCENCGTEVDYYEDHYFVGGWCEYCGREEYSGSDSDYDTSVCNEEGCTSEYNLITCPNCKVTYCESHTSSNFEFNGDYEAFHCYNCGHREPYRCEYCGADVDYHMDLSYYHQENTSGDPCYLCGGGDVPECGHGAYINGDYHWLCPYHAEQNDSSLVD